MVYLADRFGHLGRDGVQVRLQRCEELGVQRGDQIVVVLLLAGCVEGVPRQLVEIPCVLQLNVGKAYRHGSVRLGEEGYVQVRAEGDCGGNGRLAIRVNSAALPSGCFVFDALPFRGRRRARRTQ